MMRIKVLIPFVSIVFFVQLCCLPLKAQDGGERIPPKSELASMIDSIATLVSEKYIDAEMGQKTAAYIRDRYETGVYDGLPLDSLGQSLRTDFLWISDDVHMNAFYNKNEKVPQASLLATKMDEYGESSNYGYVDLSISKDNIGYLKIAHFTNWPFFEEAKKAVDHSMAMLQHTDALIIDLRGNPGGFEDIVAYLMSYFFDGDSRQLQRYYCRYLNQQRIVSLSPKLPGKQLPELPVFILVDYDTGSAAESFAYMMKHLERGTVIGDTTVGAGNGSTYFRVSDDFMVQIATWETINAVTQSSWEKQGVIPNITTADEEAMAQAQTLAKEASQKYRTQKIESYQAQLDALDAAIAQHKLGDANQAIIDALMACQKLRFFDENAINNLGYRFLLDEQKPAVAAAILETNTLLYPQSANVYDSYAEALVANGKLEEAASSFQRAVEIAEQTQDPSLALFKENLAKIQAKLEKRR